MKVISTGLLLAVVAAASANNALTRGRRDVCPMLKTQMACQAITDKAACVASTDCKPADDQAGSCESATGQAALMALMGPAMGPIMMAAMKCAFITDATACGAEDDCEFADGKCGANMAKAMKSITDPGLKMIMTAQMTCKDLKGAACSANTDCQLDGEGCGMGEGVMMSLAAKCGITKPGVEGAKGNACKGLNAMMDLQLVCVGSDEKACGAKKTCGFKKRRSKSRRDEHLKGEQGEAGEAGEAGAAGENYDGECEPTDSAMMKDITMADMLAVQKVIKPTEACDDANGDKRLRRDEHMMSDADREKKCKAAHAICGWEDDYDNLKKDGTFGKHCNAEGKKTVALIGCDSQLAAKYYRWMAKKAQAAGKKFAGKAKQAEGKVAAGKKMVAALKARKAKCAGGGRDRRDKHERFGVKSNSTKAPQTKADDCSAAGKAALDKQVSTAEADLATEEKAISAFTKAEGAQKATEATLDKDAAAKDAESSATGLASCLATVLPAAIMAVAF